MIPEVAVAMLACARIGAIHNVVFGGFCAESVKERMEFSEAKTLITVDGARRKGKTAPIKEQPSTRSSATSWTRSSSSSATDNDAPMKDGRDHWYARAARGRGRRVPAGADGRRGPAVHPLHVRLHRQAEGHPAHHRRLPDRRRLHPQVVFDLKPEEDVYWCAADVGWVTGHSYIVYGPLANGATSVMCEGAPDYPDKDIWWEIVERYKVTIFYCAPTAIRACMKWGTEHPRSTTCLAAAARHGRRADQPEGLALVPKVVGGERCPIVDTWWQTETGAIMITTLPALLDTKPGSAGKPLPGSRPRWSTRRATTPAPSRAT